MSFSAVFLVLLAGHHAGDRWAQTDRQATHKHLPGRAGWEACAAHVATLTLCQMVLLAVVAAAEGGLSPAQLSVGLAVTAVSHFWIDRRRTLEGLAKALGRHGYYRRDAEAMDQAAHVVWLVPAALIATAPSAAVALAMAGGCVLVLAAMEDLSRRGRTALEATSKASASASATV
ncbi:DUF3307 domain-containing protein [Nocardiopsis sp. L17-MgMaSL7]|uniref:DUF3307 domain-containing protein n=1 Tax=Nocardiopsis sp. L17-MgMaSL7 TaxID=1938893 RepID=UPI000D70C68D|nr:DUF3307 domain-containing protein [Nocardiopsis sp. L17-MgMaSL7]PWV44565.1 uncharacterized protein DUF3307 [Nocardiopsis sp. L17-MgMaSL7]